MNQPGFADHLATDLPATWTRAAISDVAHVEMGQSPPSEHYNENGDGLPFFQGKAEFGDLYPKVAKWCSRPGKIADAGAILMSIRAPVGPTNLAAERCSIGRGLAAITPRRGIETRYLLYAIRRYADVLAKQGTGTTFAAVNGRQVSAFRVPLAPTAEQARIADRIDELFTDLAAGVAALERVKRNLARYRAAVLHAAVTGRLVPSRDTEWAAESRWQPLGNLIGDVEQGWSPKCEREAAASDSDWAVMTTTAIQTMAFDGAENKRLPDTLEPASQYEVEVGDLLVTRAGPRSRCGIACLVRKCRPRLILCDKAYRFRCIYSKALPEYLELALNARPITDAIERMKTGSSDSGLNLTQTRFRSLMVPLPPLPVQSAIVEAVNEKLSQIDGLEAEIERGLARAARLRQAILKAAFEGKLVPQDPADEPASVLLERSRREAAKGHHSKTRQPVPRQSASATASARTVGEANRST